MNKILFSLVFFASLFFNARAKEKPPVPKWTFHNPFEQKVFIENKGQYNLKEKASTDEILFGARQDGLQYFFTKNGLWIKYTEKVERSKREIEKFKEQIGEKENEDKDGEEKEDNIAKYKWVERFHHMEFNGAGASTTIIPEYEVSQVYNFSPNSKSAVSAHAYKKIIYKNLYSGIDMEIYFPEDKTGFKYNFILHPGSDPNQIQIKYPLNQDLSLNAEGNIIIQSPFGNFTDHAPIASEASTTKSVDCSFSLKKGIVQFNIGNYDHSKGLIIDPWTSTPVFAGGNNAYDVDWDNAGNCYVYGGTSPYQVLKFNSTGGLLWSYTTSFSSAMYYGDFAIDRNSGSVYMVDGFNGGGAQAIKINSAGAFVTIFNGNSLFLEMWRISFSKCTNQAVIAGGGTSNPSYTGCYLDTNLAGMVPVDVINSPTGLHDMWGLTLDAFGSAYFATAKTQVGSAGYDNIIYKVPTPALTPIIWQAAEGYNFVEVASVSYVPSTPNGFNGITMSNVNLYTYDSYILKKWNSATGAQTGSANVNGASLATMSYGGLDADDCDNLFLGLNNTIVQYNSALAQVGTIAKPANVYDVSLGANNILYSCGAGFVSADLINLLPCTILHPVNAITNPSCGTPTGSATVTVTGGNAPYTYTWNTAPVQTGSVASNLPPGTYIATIKDNSCIKQTTYDTVIISSSATLPLLAVSSASVCNGASTPLTASGATTYTWSPGTGLSTINGPNVTATPTITTTYTVTGTQAGCNGSVTSTVTVNALPIVAVNSPTVCVGTSATMNATGATTYTWSSGGTGNSLTVTPASTTNYTIAATDANGCISSGTATVNINSLPPVTATSASICPTNTATITASGASTYTWNTGATTASINAAPVSNTNYTVTATDVNGCVNTATASIVINPSLSVTASNNAPICAGATLLLSTTIGVSWVWSGPGGFSSNNQNPSATNVTVAATGTYTLTATDANGCFGTTTTSVTINPLPVPLASSNSPLCANQTLTLTATGGATYTWNGPLGFVSVQQNPSIVNATTAMSGTYLLTVIDANGCTASTSTTVVVNPLPIVTVTGNTVCVNATINLISAGGVTYLWSGPNAYSSVSQNPSIANATTNMSGSYSVTVTDANGCINGNAASVTVNPLPIITVSTGTICINQQTATLTAGGASTYNWAPVTGLSSISGFSVSANPTVTTNYLITGTDVNGCVNTNTTSVTVNPLPTITATSGTICIGQQTATLTTGGANTYNWSPATGLSSVSGFSVSANPTVTTNYLITGTDVNGCVNTNTTSVNVNPLPIVTVNSATVCPTFSGTLTAVGALTYSWTTGATTPSVIISPNATTVYNVVGIDVNTCSSSATATITVNPALVLTIGGTTPICQGTTLSLTSTPGVAWIWNGPAAYSSNSQNPNIANAQPTMSGTYSLAATDINGCADTAFINITVNPLPIPVASNNSAICANQTLNFTSNGAGVGGTYVWAGPSAYSSASQNPFITNASITMNGTYTLTVVDVNSCTSFTTTQVIVNPLPNITVTSGIICIGNSIMLTASGANTYTWSPALGLSSTFGTSVTANPTSTSSYVVTGTDNNNCVNTAHSMVTVNSLPNVTVSSTTICILKSGTLSAAGANTYAWNPTAGLSSANSSSVTVTVNATTSYTVTGTDMNGCKNIATSTVTVNPLPVLAITPQTTSGCAPLCVSFLNTTTATGSCLWAFGDGTTSTSCTPNHCFKGQGTFGASLTLTDNNGCVNSANASVIVYPVPIADFNASPQPTTILDPTIHFVDATVGAVITTYNWTFGDPNNSSSTLQNPIFIYQAVGSYPVYLTVTSNFGCKDSTLKIIKIDDDFIIYVPNAFSPNADGTNDLFFAKGEGVKDFKLYVFDRWGSQVFFSDDIYKGWDGRFQSKGTEIVQEDVYVWKIECKTSKGEAKLLKGVVSLIK